MENINIILRATSRSVASVGIPFFLKLLLIIIYHKYFKIRLVFLYITIDI